MSNEEARGVKVGETLLVGGLVVEVEGHEEKHGDVFLVTNYGNFNASVCDFPKAQVEVE